MFCLLLLLLLISIFGSYFVAAVVKLRKAVVTMCTSYDSDVTPAKCRRYGGLPQYLFTRRSFGYKKDMETLPPEVKNVSQYDLEPFKRGRRVGFYLLGKVIGEGSFAKVREAIHILTGEKVAVKVIDKKRAKEDRYISKNLRREAKILQLIRHTHIIQLLEVLETDNYYYLVMEYCAGGELLDYICTRKRLDENCAKKIIRQLISAVDVMHKNGIVHRDLKIENFLLNENEDLKIIDFGLSNTMPSSWKELYDKTGLFPQLLNTHCGSPAYAAPELLAQKNYGPQVDIWSVGINMYAMLTGFLPYMMEPFNVMEMYEKMMQRKMTPIPGFLSKECRDLLLRLLEPVPEWRITLKQIKKHKWFETTDFIPRAVSLGDMMYNKKELCESVLSYMKHHLNIKTKETVDAVACNRALHASAVYHLLVKRLDRYLKENKRSDTSPNNFSKVEIIKKATIPSRKNNSNMVNPTNNNKSKKFTFRGRKIDSSSKSQPSIALEIDEDPNEYGKDCNERKSYTETSPMLIKTSNEKVIKKSKVSRTVSDNTHLTRPKSPQIDLKTDHPEKVEQSGETRAIEVQRRIGHKRHMRSASSDNEEKIRKSIRNSLICDLNQDFLKLIPHDSFTRSTSPLDPFPCNDDSVVATRKLSFDDIPLTIVERKLVQAHSTETEISPKNETEKEDMLVKDSKDTLEADFLESNIKEQKELCPGWSITKIVKQPPLKPECFRDENSNMLSSKKEKSDYEKSSIKRKSRSASTSATVSQGKERYSKKGDRSGNSNMITPIENEIDIKSYKTMKSTDSINEKTARRPIRRVHTADSIKTGNRPTVQIAKHSNGNTSTESSDKLLDLKSLSSLIDTKVRNYSKFDRNDSKKLDDIGVPNVPLSLRTETSPELENILYNIEYINRHHLSGNDNITSEKHREFSQSFPRESKIHDCGAMRKCSENRSNDVESSYNRPTDFDRNGLETFLCKDGSPVTGEDVSSSRDKHTNTDRNQIDSKSSNATISSKGLVRHKFSKLESFKNVAEQNEAQSQNKIASINKIAAPKKSVKVNVHQFTQFKNLPSATGSERLGNMESLTKGTTLKPLEITFDFLQLKERAGILKNQAKSLPNVNDLENEDDVPPKSVDTHEYNSHIYNSSDPVDPVKSYDNNMGYSTSQDLRLFNSHKYYSSFSLATQESIV